MEDMRGIAPKKKGLGRGLGALIPSAETPKIEKRIFFYVGIEEISPNPFQPRKKVKDAAIDQLAESVKEKGIIQPLQKMHILIQFPHILHQDVKFDLRDAVLMLADGFTLFIDGLEQPPDLLPDDLFIHGIIVFR